MIHKSIYQATLQLISSALCLLTFLLLAEGASDLRTNQPIKKLVIYSAVGLSIGAFTMATASTLALLIPLIRNYKRKIQ